jgi:hypothetical protein
MEETNNGTSENICRPRQHHQIDQDRRQVAFTPVVERKGKIIRDHVLINGKDEHHPEGRYYLEWYIGWEEASAADLGLRGGCPGSASEIPRIEGT